MVSAGAEGTLEILQTTQKSVPQQVTEQTQVGNRLVPVTKTVTVSIPMQQIIRVSLDDKGVQVYGADGKKIDPKDVGKRIAKPVPALLSADGKPVDPFYLRLAREETLVLVIPTPEAAPAPKPPAAKPVPVQKR
jgi:hypothetical protein